MEWGPDCSNGMVSLLSFVCVRFVLCVVPTSVHCLFCMDFGFGGLCVGLQRLSLSSGVLSGLLWASWVVVLWSGCVRLEM